jgi:hypothetical protein
MDISKESIVTAAEVLARLPTLYQVWAVIQTTSMSRRQREKRMAMISGSRYRITQYRVMLYSYSAHVAATRPVIWWCSCLPSYAEGSERLRMVMRTNRYRGPKKLDRRRHVVSAESDEKWEDIAV